VLRPDCSGAVIIKNTKKAIKAVAADVPPAQLIRLLVSFLKKEKSKRVKVFKNDGRIAHLIIGN